MTEERLRVLFLLPFPPRLSGRHGGARVTGQLIAALAARHHVAGLYVAEPGDAAPEPALAEACDVLEAVERRGPPSALRERLAPRLALLRGTPIWATEIEEPRFMERVAEFAADWNPSVIQLEYPVTGQYLPALAGCPAPRVLVDHDPAAPGLRRWPGPLGGVTARLDARAWRTFGRRVLAAVDAAVTFTARDREELERRAPGLPIAVIPPGTEVPDEPLDPLGGMPPGALFVGNFAHPPNVEAARWLRLGLFPALRRSIPAARLTIVGPAPPPDLSDETSEGESVAGEVPDVTPYLDDAGVVVAPLWSGGGMRIKVLEALAAGKAVVATPLAVEGLGVAAGDQLEVAGTKDEFIAATTRLLSDPVERAALARQARAWALEHLGWDRSVGGYEALYRSLLAGRRPEVR